MVVSAATPLARERGRATSMYMYLTMSAGIACKGCVYKYKSDDCPHSFKSVFDNSFLSH